MTPTPTKAQTPPATGLPLPDSATSDIDLDVNGEGALDLGRDRRTAEFAQTACQYDPCDSTSLEEIQLPPTPKDRGGGGQGGASGRSRHECDRGSTRQWMGMPANDSVYMASYTFTRD